MPLNATLCQYLESKRRLQSSKSLSWDDALVITGNAEKKAA